MLVFAEVLPQVGSLPPPPPLYLPSCMLRAGELLSFSDGVLFSLLHYLGAGDADGDAASVVVWLGLIRSFSCLSLQFAYSHLLTRHLSIILPPQKLSS